ncbi:uncharacterized protein [Blastocystis hominis]|uniref:Uncharacterized protein n=1 Tax=Blastocystis hominis TaxID=12968 RepID=D8M5C1_BLAHO|nr:uncharacterized protein [Blastocystis hominis]CBK23260.2 unnamed protein product [Blastocystis hominis]|eukprot:XP_012897308.1 uncharacterized protein [Blastocystis hominis]
MIIFNTKRFIISYILLIFITSVNLKLVSLPKLTNFRCRLNNFVTTTNVFLYGIPKASLKIVNQAETNQSFMNASEVSGEFSENPAFVEAIQNRYNSFHPTEASSP